MSRVVEDSKLLLVAIGAVGLVQKFYNDLDQIETKEAAGILDILPGPDIAAEKWEITNDWMQTVGTWQGLRTAHFRVGNEFVFNHPTPAQWVSEFLLRHDDPFGLFLNQADEGRITVAHLNGKRVRKRI